VIDLERLWTAHLLGLTPGQLDAVEGIYERTEDDEPAESRGGE